MLYAFYFEKQMTTQQIKWLPNTAPNIVAYEILKSDTGINGEYTVHVQILHQIPGSNYNEKDGYFFYNDTEISYRYYRIHTLDRYGNTAEDEAPTPFQAGNDPVETPTMHTSALNEDTGGENNLQYVTTGGTPIDEATVRVYKKIDWDLQDLSTVVGSTITNAEGKWTSPVFAQPGETYTIVYHKPNLYGPDTTEITI